MHQESDQIIIFHPPIFPWNTGISLYSAYLLRWKLVWGRELIWPEKTVVLNFHPQFVAGLLSANYPNALKVHPQARNSTPISLRHRHLDDLCRRWLSHTTWNIFANKVIPLDGDEKTTLKPQPRSTHEFKTFPLPVLEYCLIHIINMQHWKTSKTRKVVHIYVTLRTCHNLFWRTSNQYHYTSLDTYDSQFWHGSYIHYTNSNTCKCNLEPCGRWLPWFPKYFPLFWLWEGFWIDLNGTSLTVALTQKPGQKPNQKIPAPFFQPNPLPMTDPWEWHIYLYINIINLWFLR